MSTYFGLSKNDNTFSLLFDTLSHLFFHFPQMQAFCNNFLNNTGINGKTIQISWKNSTIQDKNFQNTVKR